MDSLALKNRRNGRARVCEFFQQLSRSGLGELVLFVEIEDVNVFLHRSENLAGNQRDGDRESRGRVREERRQNENKSPTNASASELHARVSLYSIYINNYISASK